MNKTISKNKRKLVSINSNTGFKVEFSTSRPRAKRAKTLTLKSGNKTLTLNGRQINTLKRILAKENALNGLK